ncbi:TIGR03564 family F420-dependent LLM class oxidoreductase [Actinocrispum wychmicini]|uniref:F420-dependent oxidoreductase-like protein n=1 Tax=Actinocrispum wychmicini TaxID=1213861 RepID=A0A4R2J4N0_9PSEU|nr:TIGR03564 family F420-dependent LLM class oxidoreductase [Actinocrispum wychmicini]TCO53701.1 F420-dependent oxidoreductase-like protein [Actinocrispum wychmicini]
MRIGLLQDDIGKTLAANIAEIRAATAGGITDFWLADRLAWEPLTLITAAGLQVPEARFGTGVIRSYPRHPLTLAGHALSTQAAIGNRLTLGIGPSHEVITTGQYGYAFDKPARHLREYLTALIPLLRGEEVAYQGETIVANGQVGVPGAEPPPVLISALGPQMLKLAGELTDGTILAWAGSKSISDYFAPAITRAAAGRPAPRIVASALMAVTDDPDGTRAQVNSEFGIAATFSSYRAVLDRDGAETVGDTVVAGDESLVRKEIQRFADAGATDFVAMPYGSEEDRKRTIELLCDLTS